MPAHPDNSSICIAVSSDNNYAPYLGTTLFSLLKNNPKEAFDIFIIFTALSESNLYNFDSLVKAFPQSKIHKINYDFSLLGNVKINGHISKAAYYRIFLPLIIPETYEKCIYLDSDLLVVACIRQLWETDLGNYALAAVQDASDANRSVALDIPSSDKYFNSGVMLMNLKIWRKDELTLKVIDFIKKNPSKIEFWDQDGLNAILYDRWLPLNEKWNKIAATIYGHGIDVKKQLRGMDIINGPRIIHFAGKYKPWLIESTDPLRFLYQKYFNNTPWTRLSSCQRKISYYLINSFFELIPLGIYLLLIRGIRTFIPKG